MPSIRNRADNDLLFFDFRIDGKRCREQTLLPDNPVNRKKLQKILDKIEAEITAGTFVYANYFPGSKALKRIKKSGGAEGVQTEVAQSVVMVVTGKPETVTPVGPLFKDFATTWFDERSIEWRRSHIRSLLSTLNGRLIPHFGGKVVGSITKSNVLEFRATLGKVKGRGTKEGLSAKRINEIMGLLRQIINEAADRFEFASPVLNIKKLRQRKTDVEPFSFGDVQRILATVRVDYKNYFTTRFLTGMRTGEVHGLKWKYVDFELRIIRVRETFVLGEDEYTKTDGSQRDIQMSQPVFEALKAQFEVTGKTCEYVFCNLVGEPLDNKNFSDRVWYPLLRHLGLKARRPYQMRHTAATLWLASGEAPEWIARQLGHTSTEMLFRVYSRYVPNLTRQDGSAMERLLASQMSQGALIEQKTAGSDVAIFVPAAEVTPMVQPKPRGIPGRTPVHKAVPKTMVVTSATDAPTDTKSDTGHPPKVASQVANPISAQPPPLSWADIAQSWMGTAPSDASAS